MVIRILVPKIMFHCATYLTLVLLTVSCQRSLFASSPSTRLRRKRFSTPSFLSVPTKDNISFPQADNSTTTTLQNVYTGTNVVDGNLYNQEPQRISYLPPPELRRSLTSSQSFDWTQVGNDLDGEAAGDQSGYSVGMSADGKRVIVGARYNYGNGFRAGHARIYEDNNGTWTQVGKDLDGEAAGDQSGYSVGISADGRRVIVGAGYNCGNGAWAGHARIYEESNGLWTQVGNDLDGEAAFDQSGYSVGMSADGKRVIVGAPGNYGNGHILGHARIYEEKGESWIQVGNDLDGEAAGDQSGFSVGMSADGKRVIVGSRYNDETNELFSVGHARIYEEKNGSWTQVGNDLDGEAAYDESGYSVGMSADGRRVIAGAPSNCGNGTDAGHVRIYEAYPSESSADFPFKFLSVIGPVVGVIFISF